MKSDYKTDNCPPKGNYSDNIFVHPKPFYLIFSLELWERFGFYGMQALLVLFLVRRLGMSDALADNTFCAFSALVYAFVVVGGYVGDKLLGTKRTMVIGAFILAASYFLLGLYPERYLYWALGGIVAGNALFKANPSSLVSKLYKKGDPRIDGAFTIYYMAINIGSCAAMVATPYLEKRFGWGPAFMVSFVGLVIAIVNYWFFRKVLDGIDSQPGSEPIVVRNLIGVLLVALGISVSSTWLLQHLDAAHYLLYFAVFCALIIYFREMFKASPMERIKLIVCLVLIVEAVAFFILYQQMPTSLNLFAMRNTRHFLLGIHVETANFQALNPFWIMILSPLLAWGYGHFGRKGKDLSMPGKFALGMFLCSLGFLSLWFASAFFADASGKISGNWLIVTYGFQSTGELLVSGLGLAMVAHLAPQRCVGFIMGVWFMFQALGNVLGGFVAAAASIPETITEPLKSLPVYSSLFMQIGMAALVLSALMALAVPKLRRLIPSS